MVGRLYWASCARATSIDALLRHSPPPRRAAAYIRRQQAGGFWRATDYIRQAVVGTDVLLRRSPRVVLPQISGNSRPADFGGRLSILGGDKPCVGSGHRCSAAPLSLHRSVANIRRQRFNGRVLHRALPLAMLLQKLRNGFRRVAAGKPCVAAGADVLLRRSPRVVLPQISGDSSPTDFGGWLAILGGDKPCAGSGYRRSAAPFSPPRRSAANIRRQRFNGRALHRALPLSHAIAKVA